MVTVSADGATVMLNGFVAVTLDESRTCTVNELEPAVVGVPEIVPAGDSESPAGIDPALTLHT